jgi:secreted PhoX family phosphatase
MQTPDASTRVAGRDAERIAGRRTASEPFAAILERRLSRRAALKAAAAGATTLVAASALGWTRSAGGAASRGISAFTAIGLSDEDRVIVPAGFHADVVIAWGDPLFPDVPALDPLHQTAELQERQFGYNADGVHFFPLPAGSGNSDSGLLVVNHEYTNPELMFPDYIRAAPTTQQVAVELAAHGLSVVKIDRQAGGAWSVDVASHYNRRITGETPMVMTGPAAFHDWVWDASDFLTRGMLNNCSSGRTPWGTVLTCEENFHQYFANLDALPDDDPRKEVHGRYGIARRASDRGWDRHERRFDLGIEPNEPFRFGWVVEIDPYDPGFLPRKHTALGRIRHEAATTALTRDGRVAVYMGEDERFACIYKFVSAGRVDLTDRSANSSLLEDGTLSVARFFDDGSGEWLPLLFGEDPLTPENGFASQGDVLLDTRRAAALVGGTPMDRPEDVETNPVNGRVYCVMTNNSLRTADRVNGANPRANNRHGHIIELIEAGDDPGAAAFRWEVFLLCGDPRSPSDGFSSAGFDPALASAISCPDNVAFDRAGNLWISTDGQDNTFRMNDGVFMVPTEGPERGWVQQFLSGVPGCECASLAITPDDGTLFVSIQHPGEGGTYAAPKSLWPDGHTPPRPGVVAVVPTET